MIQCNTHIPVLFLSTPSARRATFYYQMICPGTVISIHALCEEGDMRNYLHALEVRAISIHALCEEGDRLR